MKVLYRRSEVVGSAGGPNGMLWLRRRGVLGASGEEYASAPGPEVPSEQKWILITLIIL